MNDNIIKALNLPVKVQDKLKENDVLLIGDLLALKRIGLKKLGFSNEDIKTIDIQLQLMGIDLNKKAYKIK